MKAVPANISRPGTNFNNQKTLIRQLLLLTFFIGQTVTSCGQQAMLRGKILDSTDNGYVRNAEIKFIKNDTTLFSHGQLGSFQIILEKSLSDSVVVSHQTLGSTTFIISLSDKQVKDTTIHLPKSCKELHSTDTCPVCKSNKDVINIIYGMPSKKLMKQAEKDIVHLGGCIVNPCYPKYYCKKDKLEF